MKLQLIKIDQIDTLNQIGKYKNIFVDLYFYDTLHYLLIAFFTLLQKNSYLTLLILLKFEHYTQGDLYIKYTHSPS